MQQKEQLTPSSRDGKFKRISLANLESIGEKMALKKSALACSVCGSRNYSKKVNSAGRTERLEVKKFCKYCNQHTIHRETK